MLRIAPQIRRSDYVIAFALLFAALVAGPVRADDAPLTPRDLIERAIEAHGGERWQSPQTLTLAGHATFFDPQTGDVRSVADDYRMWREFDAARDKAHGASGKVRITAKDGERTLFEVGYDGETTWTERGIMPQEAADRYWASNFGFGIVRQALEPGFTLHFAPTRDLGGRQTMMVRIVDPQGQQTLFGFDWESGFITYLAFDTPRGFHERYYSDFVKLDNGWVQARDVILLYDGIMANRVFWRETVIDAPVDPALFSPPPGMQAAE